MPLKLYNYKVHSIHVILIVLWMQLHQKWKSHISLWCWSYGVKYRKKNYWKLWFLWENIFNQRSIVTISKMYGSVLWPFFDILMNWAISRIHRTGYENFIFNFEDIRHRKIVLYQTLIVLFQSSKPVSSRVLVETSQIDGFFMLYVPLTLWGLRQ